MKKAKTRSPFISMVKDIIFIFLVCVFILCLVNIKGNRENHPLLFWDFNGDTVKANPPKAKQEKTILRKFKWKYPKETNRETVFYIPADSLKKEIKKFGLPYGMTHPLLMEKRGFKVDGIKYYLDGQAIQERLITTIDYKQIFQRNLQYFGELTKVLQSSADLSPGEDSLHPFLTFVQHIRYQLPPRYYHRKFINAFFVPLVCLYEQYGDCDSKSLLLADFLCTVPGTSEKAAMVLIRGGGLTHALLAVKRNPLPGMTSLHDFKRGYYIVLETTRPGWAPGFINRRVTDALKAGFFQFVELN
ncbi:MAG: hypothetical protein JSV88_18325 [Candidatus Aminicenantes bacterium]|nr:MAG: hypothetical protein JSV88_18325 [Candidatus Aminicenantes bacterium]